MDKYTSIRLCWYVPLLEIISHKRWLKEEYQWLSEASSNLKHIKEKKAFISNFKKIKFEDEFNYPIIKKDIQLRILNDFNFPPIYYAGTSQKKVKFRITNQKNNHYIENCLQSIKFNVKVYPTGFIALNANLHINGWFESPINHRIYQAIIVGKKESNLKHYIQYLKYQIIKSLFVKERLDKIETIVYGPKIRVNLIGKTISRNKFEEITQKIFDLITLNGIFKQNPKTNDYFYFHKKGICTFTDISLNNSNRQFFRNNIDFIMDIVFGTELLIPIIPSYITKIDKDSNLDINQTLLAIIYSLNPSVLAGEDDLKSSLPSAGLRKWYTLQAKVVKLPEKYLELKKQLLERINKLRINSWYEIITLLLIENIPHYSSEINLLLDQTQQNIRELISPKIQLDEKNAKIIDYLISLLFRDLDERFNPPVNDRLDEEELGFSTLYQIEKEFEIGGRDHMDFKNRIDMLNAIGLIESKPYKGPGSRKDSKKYRANPIHAYVYNFLKKELTDQLISMLKIDSL